MVSAIQGNYNHKIGTRGIMNRFSVPIIFIFLVTSFAITGCISENRPTSEKSTYDENTLASQDIVEELRNNLTQKEDLIKQLLEENNNLSSTVSEFRLNQSADGSNHSKNDDTIALLDNRSFTNLEVQKYINNYEYWKKNRN